MESGLERCGVDRRTEHRAAATLVILSIILFGSVLAAEPLSLDVGFRQMYNLNFPAAHKTFQQWQRTYPDDPFGYMANAAAYLFSEFDRLRILELELFTDNDRFEGHDRTAVDPAIRTAFLNELAKADAMAARTLAHSPNDRNARLAKVLSDGLRADYLALIEKRNMASLKYIKRARSAAEGLLLEDPTCYDAYLALGVENYLLGVNAAPVRWVLRLSGAQTDKKKGIEKLRITAEKGRYLAPFARLLLAVAALRDNDPATARVLLQDLAREFPNNRLYAQELARLTR